MISCTNTDDDPATVTVEIYDTNGAMVATGTSGTMNFQHTRSIGAQSIGAIAMDNNLSAPLTVSKGLAKIFSTNKSVMCTAFVADSVNSPPTSMTYLTVVPGTKQK